MNSTIHIRSYPTYFHIFPWSPLSHPMYSMIIPWYPHIFYDVFHDIPMYSYLFVSESCIVNNHRSRPFRGTSCRRFMKSNSDGGKAARRRKSSFDWWSFPGSWRFHHFISWWVSNGFKIMKFWIWCHQNVGIQGKTSEPGLFRIQNLGVVFFPAKTWPVNCF